VAYHRSSAAHFQHQDWMGTERIRTTYNGNVEGTFTSLAFGDDQTTASGTDGDTYHYAMLDHDGETNTDHAQFRQYSNTQGRWLSPDPYSGSYDFNDPQSFNRYVYASNNPLSAIDPSGLESDAVCGDDDPDCVNGGEDTSGGSGDGYGSDFGYGFGNASGCDMSDPYSNCVVVNGTIPGCNMSDSLCQWTFQSVGGVPGGIPLAGGQGGPHGSGNGKTNWPPTDFKPLFCTGDALAAKGLSIGLDVVGAIPGLGNMVSAGAAGARAVDAVVTWGGGVIGAATSLDDPVGAASSSGGLGLALANVTLGGTKAIPIAGNILSGATGLWDAYGAYKAYQSCMSSSKYN